MIDTRELRIGNYVCCRIGIENAKKYSPFGVIVSVSEAHTCAINYNVPPEIRSLFYKGKFEDDFNPIPLTEEILIKCGFVDGSQGYRATGHNFAFSKDVNSQCKIDLYQGDHYHEASQTYGWHIGYYPNMIYYLHQLQNLYFALTGEELNLNL